MYLAYTLYLLLNDTNDGLDRWEPERDLTTGKSHWKLRLAGWLPQKAACRGQSHSIHEDLAIKQRQCVCASVASLSGFLK